MWKPSNVILWDGLYSGLQNINIFNRGADHSTIVGKNTEHKAWYLFNAHWISVSQTPVLVSEGVQICIFQLPVALDAQLILTCSFQWMYSQIVFVLDTMKSSLNPQHVLIAVCPRCIDSPFALENFVTETESDEKSKILQSSLEESKCSKEEHMFKWQLSDKGVYPQLCIAFPSLPVVFCHNMKPI